MRFDGLEPWPEGEPVVECVTGSLRYDLHNSGSLLGWQWRPGPAALIVQGTFDPVGLGGAIRHRDGLPRAIVLRFSRVKDLEVRSPPELREREVDLIEEWTWHRAGDDRGDVELELGVQRLCFSTDEVAFRANVDLDALDARRAAST